MLARKVQLLCEQWAPTNHCFLFPSIYLILCKRLIASTWSNVTMQV